MWKNGLANFKNLAVIEFLHKKRIKLNSGWTFSRLLTDGWNETIGSNHTNTGTLHSHKYLTFRCFDVFTQPALSFADISIFNKNSSCLNALIHYNNTRIAVTTLRCLRVFLVFLSCLLSNK